MKIITSIAVGLVVALCIAAAIYIFSMLFMLMWNEGPAYIFSWPKIDSWWRATLLLLCSLIIFSSLNASKK